MSGLAPGEWVIERSERRSEAKLNGTALCVLANNGQEQKMFHRVFKRAWGGGGEPEGRVLVAELNGVRLYVKGDQMIMTTEDLYF